MIDLFSDTLIQLIEALSDVPAPELALRLYLQCAEVFLGSSMSNPKIDICESFSSGNLLLPS